MFFKLLVFGFKKNHFLSSCSLGKERFFFYNLANQVVCDLSEKLYISFLGHFIHLV